MPVVLITGAATGIGRLTALRLAQDGHTVWASMRDPLGRNAARAADLTSQEGLDLHVVELDVSSQESADRAVATVVETSGRLDVVVQNAGHLAVGYVEAFTAEEVAHLVDVNAIGAHRVNRAALPHLRAQRSGTLVYVGSTIVVTTPPFLGPYVAAKAAFDALAVVTSYEVSQLGIETSIVIPGAITQGTAHFPNAGRASGTEVAAAYADLDTLVARNEEATAALLRPGQEADPQQVADEIARVVALPRGQKPFRTVVDAAEAGADHVLALADMAREAFVHRLGFSETLELRG